MSDAKVLNDSLAANYMLVRAQLRSWGATITDRAVSNEVIASKGAARKSGKFVKSLFVDADAELVAVHSLGNALRAFIYAKTLPWTGNTDGPKKGDRILNAKDVMPFLKEFGALKKEYDQAVLAFDAVYEDRKAQAIINLGGMAKESDYPPRENIIGMFAVSVDVMPVPSVADFSRVNVPVPLAQALGERFGEQNKIMADNMLADMKQQLLEQLQRMATQLHKTASGTTTRLYDSLVTNLQELVALARSMNVYGNPGLQELTDKIEKQLLAHPVEVYRVHPKKAADVATAAQHLAVEAALEDIWR